MTAEYDEVEVLRIHLKEIQKEIDNFYILYAESIEEIRLLRSILNEEVFKAKREQYPAWHEAQDIAKKRTKNE